MANVSDCPRIEFGAAYIDEEGRWCYLFVCPDGEGVVYRPEKDELFKKWPSWKDPNQTGSTNGDQPELKP